MDRTALIDKIVGLTAGDPAVRGLFLSGSLGRGDGDQYSDIDFVAVLGDDDHQAFAVRWRAALEAIAEVVFWHQRGTSEVLLNAVTADWQRVDVFTTRQAAFQSRTQDTLKPLIDHDGLFAALAPKTVPRGADRDRVAWAIGEFIRVLGLLHVAAGRKEYYVAVIGAALLRDQLVTIMTEMGKIEGRGGDDGGVLHLSKVLSREDMQVLTSLPFPRPERAAVVEAILQTARVFFPRARALASALDLEWPAAFEQATARVLQVHLGAEFDVTW